MRYSYFFLSRLLFSHHSFTSSFRSIFASAKPNEFYSSTSHRFIELGMGIFQEIKLNVVRYVYLMLIWTAALALLRHCYVCATYKDSSVIWKWMCSIKRRIFSILEYWIYLRYSDIFSEFCNFGGLVSNWFGKLSFIRFLSIHNFAWAQIISLSNRWENKQISINWYRI